MSNAVLECPMRVGVNKPVVSPFLNNCRSAPDNAATHIWLVAMRANFRSAIVVPEFQQNLEAYIKGSHLQSVLKPSSSALAWSLESAAGSFAHSKTMHSVDYGNVIAEETNYP